MANNGLLLAGRALWNQRDDSGNLTGYREFGNTVKCGIKQDGGSKAKRLSTGEDNWGQTLDTANRPGSAMLSLESDEFSRDAIVLAFLGSDAVVTVTGAAVADAAVTLIKDRWVRLAHRNISLSPAPAIEALVLGTDYVIDYRDGLIMALTSGAVGSKSIDYTHGGVSGFAVDGFVRTQISGQLLLIGKNIANNHRIELEIPNCVLTPTGDEIDFMSQKEFLKLSFGGDMLPASGYSGPFRYTDLDAF